MTVPQKLSKAEREALEEYRKTSSEHPREPLRTGAQRMDRPTLYMISVAAELVGCIHRRCACTRRRVSCGPRDTGQHTAVLGIGSRPPALIQRLTTERGSTSRVVEHVLRLEDELRRARALMERLERELRDEIREVHRTYPGPSWDIVLWEAPKHPVPRK